MNKKIFRISIFLAIAISLFTISFAQAFQIASNQLQEKQRVGRTLYEYTYTVSVLNDGNGATAVSATISSINPNTIIVDGQVNFGDVTAGSTVPSTDTFTIRQDRSYTFNPANIVWNYSFTPSTPGGQLPPDPAEVAPAIDSTVATTVAASAALLYSGVIPSRPVWLQRP